MDTFWIIFLTFVEIFLATILIAYLKIAEENVNLLNEQIIEERKTIKTYLRYLRIKIAELNFDFKINFDVSSVVKTFLPYFFFNKKLKFLILILIGLSSDIENYMKKCEKML